MAILLKSLNGSENDIMRQKATKSDIIGQKTTISDISNLV